jgi:hypothetical protein
LSDLRIARLFGPGVLADDPVLELGARDHRQIEVERENDDTTDSDNVGVRLRGRLRPPRNGWRVSFRHASAPRTQVTSPASLIALGTIQTELPPGVHVPPVLKFNELNQLAHPSAELSRAVLGPQLP